MRYLPWNTFNHDTYNDVMYNGMLYLPKKNYIYRSLFVLTRSHSVLFCLLYLYSLSQAFQPSKQSAGRKTPFFYHVTQQFIVT